MFIEAHDVPDADSSDPSVVPDIYLWTGGDGLGGPTLGGQWLGEARGFRYPGGDLGS